MKLIGTLLVVVLLAAAWWLYEPQASISHEVAIAQATPLVDEALPAEEESQVDKIATYYLERYGSSIQSVVTQASLLSELDQLQKDLPVQGRSLFDQAVTQAFPAMATEILRLIDRLIAYENWLDGNTAQLNRLEPAEGLAKLWQKRYELFGLDADELWADSVFDVDAKQTQIQNELDRLSKTDDLSTEAIADEFISRVDDIFGNSVAGAIVSPSDVSQAILSLNSVQSDLASMNPDDRAQTLESLRKKAGFSDEAILRLAERDLANQRKWDLGYQYMDARDQLAKQYSGVEYQQELQSLQQESFGSQASTIAAEERSGFNRFDRPRRYGVN